MHHLKKEEQAQKELTEQNGVFHSGATSGVMTEKDIKYMIQTGIKSQKNCHTKQESHKEIGQGMFGNITPVMKTHSGYKCHTRGSFTTN